MIHQRILALYRRHFRDARRERMFLASLCFFITFGLARFTTHYFRDALNPYRVLIGGTHVHHLVWGIALLLGVGYMTLIQPRVRAEAVRYGRIMAVLYGVGAALTLDEFALWLKLRDVYWEQEGRASIDAVLLFGALVSAGFWGGPFVRAVGRQLMRPVRKIVALVRTPPPLEEEPGSTLPLTRSPLVPEPVPASESAGSAIDA